MLSFPQVGLGSFLVMAAGLALPGQGWIDAEARQQAFLRDRPLETRPPEGWRHGLSLFATTVGWGDRSLPVAWGQGFGTSIRGQGMALAHSFARGDGWATVSYRVGRDSETGTLQAQVLTWGLTWHPPQGWRLALEQEPLVWGQGLQGGYLLGEGAMPFPKVRVRSPWWELGLFGIPLGTWRGEFFLGQLEDHRILPREAQNPYVLREVERVNGEVDRPRLSGYRAEARFGPKVDFALGVVSMWGGRNRLTGERLDRGWGLSDYGTAIFGLDTALAERAVGYTEDKPIPEVDFVNKARSNALIAVDLRFRPEWMRRLLRAESATFYLTRGADSANWQFSRAYHNPWNAFWNDLDRLRRNLDRRHLRNEWTNGYRDFAPSLDQPQDTLGFTFHWGNGVEAGVEYSDTVNSFKSSVGFRTYTHAMWPAGHSRKGDILGHAYGADQRLVLGSLGLPLGTWRLRVGAGSGQRPFRDSLADWQAIYGLVNPERESFVQGDLALEVQWRGWDWSLRGQARRTLNADHMPGNLRRDAQAQLLVHRTLGGR